MLVGAGSLERRIIAGFSSVQQRAKNASIGRGRSLECRILGQQGNVKLNLWRKRISAPKRGAEPLPVLFLVHGSSNSARSSYDLTVPGKGEYSMMNVMARNGYDVWTMDHDGYGLSGSSGNNSDIASGVEDLKAAIPVVMKEPDSRKCISSARRRARSAPVPTRRRNPNGSTG